jgi:hypothetical protein
MNSTTRASVDGRVAEPQWKHKVVHHVCSPRFNKNFEDIVVVCSYVKNT